MNSAIYKNIKTILTTVLVLFSISDYSFAQKRKLDIFKNDTNFVIPKISMPKINNDSLTKFYDNQSKSSNYVIAKYFEISEKDNGIADAMNKGIENQRS